MTSASGVGPSQLSRHSTGETSIDGPISQAYTDHGSSNALGPRIVVKATVGSITVATAAPTASVCQPRDESPEVAGCSARKAHRAATAGIAGST